MELADCPGDLGELGFQINRRAIVEIMTTVGNITVVTMGRFILPVLRKRLNSQVWRPA
jgi:hypothetical protein